MTGVDPDALAFLRHKEISLELIEEIVPELFGGTFFAQEAQRTGAAFLPEGLFAHVIQARGRLGRTSGSNHLRVLPPIRRNAVA